MNITDLRDELDVRSDPGVEPLAAARLAGVRSRVRAIRTRRAATAVAAAIAVVAAVIAGYSMMPRTSAPPPQPANPTTTVNGFPEYAVGGHVVATATAALPTRRLALEPVPAGPLGFVVTERCDGLPEGVRLWVSWTANGHSLTNGTCGPGGGSYVTPDRTLPPELGINAYELVTFEVRVERAERDGVQVPVPATGEVAVAVLERMSFEEYPLPPRPATLTPLTRDHLTANMYPENAIAVVDSDPADPNAVRSVTIQVPANATLHMVAQTPGSIEVRLDGTVVSTDEWWDYELGLHGTSVTTGGHTLEFRPRHMTGAWRAVIQPPHN